MSFTTKVEMKPTQEILLKRGLNKNGKAQVFFTKECAKAFNNYVPFLTGRLKDMSVTMGPDYVRYNEPYAAIQYTRNMGTGKEGFCNGGIRGPFWDKRCWINKGDELVKKIADFCGVKFK